MSATRFRAALAAAAATLALGITAAPAAQARVQEVETEASTTTPDVSCTTTTLRPLDVPLEGKVCIKRSTASSVQALLVLPPTVPRGLMGPQATCAAKVDLVEVETGRRVNESFAAATGPCSGQLWGPTFTIAADRPVKVHAVAGVKAELPGRPVPGPPGDSLGGFPDQFRPSPPAALAFATCSTGTLAGDTTTLTFAGGHHVEIEFVTTSLVPTLLQVTNSEGEVTSGGPFPGAPWYYTTVARALGPHAIHTIKIQNPGGGPSDVKAPWPGPPAVMNAGAVGYKVRSDQCFTKTGAPKYDQAPPAPEQRAAATPSPTPSAAPSPTPQGDHVPLQLPGQTAPGLGTDTGTSTPRKPEWTFRTQRLNSQYLKDRGENNYLVVSRGRPNGPEAERIWNDGTDVRIECQAHGPAVDGQPYTVWSKLAGKDLWVYDFYLTTTGDGFAVTGPKGSGLPLCDGWT